ncbi:hypothetical protein [Bradyrhizobium sp. 188]|uniref:hypothetical protein n=1 Tax=Bradyrhizobium sp. 188 TaxID=2782656 RepID=UPI001FF72B4B|nr:hypothetical protein [Bradyrhizobium sp. 188]MCK1502836.1 hypothetical protein [Bradyrhizobium sp. 188]
MYQADRSERIKALVKVALAILPERCRLHYPSARRPARVYDFRYNHMALSLRRQIDNPAHTRKLEIWFQGERMLFAEWTDDGFTKRSYRSGVGKRGYVGTNRVPALAGRVKAAT